MYAFEKRWVQAIVESLAPVGTEGLSPIAGECDYVGTFERMRSASTPKAAFGLRMAVWIFAFAPVWFRFRFRIMPTLAMAERTELMSALLSSRTYLVRELGTLFKIVASLSLMGVPSIRARTTYDQRPEKYAQGPHADRRRLPIAAGDSSKELS